MLKIPSTVSAVIQRASLVHHAENDAPVQEVQVLTPPRKTHAEMLKRFLLLQLDLFPETVANDDITPDPEPLAASTVEAESQPEKQLSADEADPMDNPSNWSDQSFCKLAEGMIDWHLRCLRPGAHVSLRNEALQWLFRSAQTLVFTSQGTHKYIPTYVVPFSFRQLCLLSGYDADALLGALYGGFEKAGQLEALTMAGITDGDSYVSTYH